MAGMRRFAETCDAVAATAKKTEKVRLVAAYLASLPTQDAALASVFFAGRVFPQWEERTLSVGGTMLWRAVAEISAADAASVTAAYRSFGDLGSAAEKLLAGHVASGLSLAELRFAFDQIASRRGSIEKAALVRGLLERATPHEAKYVVKIITGDLRIGLKEGLVEEAIAQASGQSVDQVRRANLLTGDLGRTFELAAAGALGSAALRLFHPLGFMLASPAESGAEILELYPGGVLVEDKYDGVRVQAHKRGERVKLFSRTLDELVEFPELVGPLLDPPGEWVLDGEILGWRDGRALPFTELQKRLGRKHADLWLERDVPVSYVVFDLLYQDGELLLEAPLSERRRRLERLLDRARVPIVQVAPVSSAATVEALERAFEAALERGNEGLMAKAGQSVYAPGRRGRSWLKLKRPMSTLDVVVKAVEFGHGKRHGVLSDYTFAVRDGDRLAVIGKAYSGLTDAEIAELTQYFLAHTLVDEGFRRQVEPTIVLEVAFNNIQRSSRHDSGFALRFPRIVRLRPDKSAQEIDTLDRVRDLYERQSHVSREDQI